MKLKYVKQTVFPDGIYFGTSELGEVGAKLG